jgi:subtilisin family serine protease
MPADRAADLAKDPTVATVEADTTVKTAVAPPSWGLDRIDQADLPLDGSYTQPVSASAVTVYVIDSGVRITHQDFGGRATHGYDFVDNDPVADDGLGHGTHVAATIGGETYGVAKDVNLVAVRAFGNDGSGDRDDIIAAIDWVITNATGPSVVNMSFGGIRSELENAVVKAATNAGIVVVAAAGNDTLDACEMSPASTPEAITVGASDVNDQMADFSNWGGCVDVFAPGVDIISATNTSDSAFAEEDGTSMAAPHVAGAAALLLAVDPTATPAQVQHDVVAAATPATVTGLPACTTGRLLTVGLPAGPGGTDVPPAATGDLGAPVSAFAGGALTVTGAGFDAGTTVTFTMYPGEVELGESTAPVSGQVSPALILPAGVTCDVTVVASGVSGGVARVLSARVAIVPPSLVITPPPPAVPAPAPALTLPLTGTEPIGLAAGGAGLVLAGVAAILVAGLRRRTG